MSSSNKKIDLSKILRTGGYNLPMEESEVEDFERNNEREDSKPQDWDNPLKIIARGKISAVTISEVEKDLDAIQNFSMAAREGKGISDEVRNLMNADRKNAKKQ